MWWGWEASVPLASPKHYVIISNAELILTQCKDFRLIV